MKHVWKPCLPTLAIHLKRKRFQKTLVYVSSRHKTPSLTAPVPVLNVLGVEINKDMGLRGGVRG